MHALSNNHTPAILQMMTGFIQPGRPCLGAWTVYGLGTENQNLPAFVVLLDKMGGPLGGAQKWSSGFMPAAYQGTPFRNQGQPIADLASPNFVEPEQQRARLDFIKELNQIHLQENAGDSELAARIDSYELGFPHAEQRAGSGGPFQGERGDAGSYTASTIRTASISRTTVCWRAGWWSAACDSCSSMAAAMPETIPGTRTATSKRIIASAPRQWTSRSAGLLKDLKGRGLLDSTLVVWHTEFGRLPISQSISRARPRSQRLLHLDGRRRRERRPGDRRHRRFRLSGRGGTALQSTTCTPRSCTRWASITRRLTYFYNGRPQRLTDVSGEVIQAVMG